MKVLIVDDSRVMRKLIREALGRGVGEGLELFEASDGLEALGKLEEGMVVDLILVDWTMPRMDGITFVGVLRGREGLKEIPVVMLTSQSQPSQRAEAAQLGVKDYVLKPFDADALCEKVRQVIARDREGKNG